MLLEVLRDFTDFKKFFSVFFFLFVVVYFLWFYVLVSALVGTKYFFDEINYFLLATKPTLFCVCACVVSLGLCRI